MKFVYQGFFVALLLAVNGLVFTNEARAQTPAPVRVAVPFTGRVTDQATGEGLPGATILFPDLRQVTVTDPAGNFQFSNLPRGRFLMQVSYVGYNTLSHGAAPLVGAHHRG